MMSLKPKHHYSNVFRSIVLLIVAQTSILCSSTQAATKQSVSDVEFGTVLFEYYQQRYFDALVEYEYSQSNGNTVAASTEGKLLRGGMMVSYGMLDPAYNIFSELLANKPDQAVRNRAWYHLGNFFYNKSNMEQAVASLSKIDGDLDEDTYLSYLNLAALLNVSTDHIVSAEEMLKSVPADSAYRAYLQFNLAIGKLANDQVEDAVDMMEKLSSYSGADQERLALADRARHGLSQIAMQKGQYERAWSQLKRVRTSGLYSNRALLSYSWASIKLERYKEAIPALEMLNSRPIVTSEVQEAKVLLAHLHEQRGATRLALKANIEAEEAFREGIVLAEEAKATIAERNILRDFLTNFGQMTSRSDRYGDRPDINYQNLTPFLLDLISSNEFNEVLKELADLYALKANLEGWDQQIEQHSLILASSSRNAFGANIQNSFEESNVIRKALQEQQEQLSLMSKKDQKRMRSLVSSLEKDLASVILKISSLKEATPYKPKGNMQQLVAERHREVKEQLRRTENHIGVLEPVMRDLINEELDRHIERMRYYSAQARLAKVRLYDSALLELEQTKAGGE